MSLNLPIRRVLALRVKHGDRVAMDYLTIALLLGGTPGLCKSMQLQKVWGVTQPSVSRRINRLADVGLIDVTTGHGAYEVHDLRLL